MDLLNLEISPGKFVDFEVYVFDTGKYLRHGKYERDYWWYWGESKKFYDPAAMHVHFEKAQQKLNPDDVKKQQDANATKAKAAADATAAVKASNTAAPTQSGATAQEVNSAPGAAPVQAAAAQGPSPSFTSRMSMTLSFFVGIAS